MELFGRLRGHEEGLARFVLSFITGDQRPEPDWFDEHDEWFREEYEYKAGEIDCQYLGPIHPKDLSCCCSCSPWACGGCQCYPCYYSFHPFSESMVGPKGADLSYLQR